MFDILYRTVLGDNEMARRIDARKVQYCGSDRQEERDYFSGEQAGVAYVPTIRPRYFPPHPPHISFLFFLLSHPPYQLRDRNRTSITSERQVVKIVGCERVANRFR